VTCSFVRPFVVGPERGQGLSRRPTVGSVIPLQVLDVAGGDVPLTDGMGRSTPRADSYEPARARA
jgi:hypothetical protein